MVIRRKPNDGMYVVVVVVNDVVFVCFCFVLHLFHACRAFKHVPCFGLRKNLFVCLFA